MLAQSGSLSGPAGRTIHLFFFFFLSLSSVIILPSKDRILFLFTWPIRCNPKLRTYTLKYKILLWLWGVIILLWLMKRKSTCFDCSIYGQEDVLLPDGVYEFRCYHLLHDFNPWIYYCHLELKHEINIDIINLEYIFPLYFFGGIFHNKWFTLIWFACNVLRTSINVSMPVVSMAVTPIETNEFELFGQNWWIMGMTVFFFLYCYQL